MRTRPSVAGKLPSRCNQFSTTPAPFSCGERFSKQFFGCARHHPERRSTRRARLPTMSVRAQTTTTYRQRTWAVGYVNKMVVCQQIVTVFHESDSFRRDRRQAKIFRQAVRCMVITHRPCCSMPFAVQARAAYSGLRISRRVRILRRSLAVYVVADPHHVRRGCADLHHCRKTLSLSPPIQGSSCGFLKAGEVGR